MNEPVFRTEDPWKLLRNYTDARIALGRVGASLPTAAVLAFSLAHARARDAVLSELDADAVERSLGVLGLGIVRATSRCRDKGEYLRRPDLGRRLSDSSRRELEALAPERGCELAIVVADGLSSAAIERQAFPSSRASCPSFRT
jgi:ethanolamine ammonia-lyase small subunit